MNILRDSYATCNGVRGKTHSDLACSARESRGSASRGTFIRLGCVTFTISERMWSAETKSAFKKLTYGEKAGPRVSLPLYSHYFEAIRCTNIIRFDVIINHSTLESDHKTKEFEKSVLLEFPFFFFVSVHTTFKKNTTKLAKNAKKKIL